MGKHSKSLLFYEKAFEIWLKTLPTNHPNLAISYNNIGSMYDNMGEYSKALLYYEHAQKIWQSSLPANHPRIKTVQKNIEALRKKL
jgi:tetratricopeptide (TPR) repeat protein